jgi:hypothetical protein
MREKFFKNPGFSDGIKAGTGGQRWFLFSFQGRRRYFMWKRVGVPPMG